MRACWYFHRIGELEEDFHVHVLHVSFVYSYVGVLDQTYIRARKVGVIDDFRDRSGGVDESEDVLFEGKVGYLIRGPSQVSKLNFCRIRHRVYGLVDFDVDPLNSREVVAVVVLVFDVARDIAFLHQKASVKCGQFDHYSRIRRNRGGVGYQEIDVEEIPYGFARD